MKPHQPTRYLSREQKQCILLGLRLELPYDRIIARYHNRFGKYISKGTITKIKQKYKREGNVENKNRVNSGRPHLYDERGQWLIMNYS